MQHPLGIIGLLVEGDNQNDDLGVHCPKILGQLQAAFAGEHNVGQHDIRL